MRRFAPVIPTLLVACLLWIPAVRAAGPSPRADTAIYLWTLQDVPTTANLTAVWGASEFAVFAVGHGGTVLRFDGTRWTQMAFPDNVPLGDVWGTSASNIYAISDRKLYVCDGTTWMDYPTQPPLEPRGVWALSPSDIVVVGNGVGSGTGVVAQWDGSMWLTPPTFFGFSRLRDVWGDATNSVFAVSDDDGAIYRRYECAIGRITWEKVDVLPMQFSAVHGSSSRDVYAVSHSGLGHYDGGPVTTYCQQNWVLAGPTTTLRGVWGNAPDDVYAVGFNSGLGIASYILHYDGVDWIPESAETVTRAFAPLNAVWSDGIGNAWAVGESGVILRNTPGVPDTTLTVNSTGTARDAVPGDGVCDTGRTTVNGDPECTLCAAIDEANTQPDADGIKFDIPTGDPGYRAATGTFEIRGALPIISQPVVIDGSTQPGFSTRPVIDLDFSGQVGGIIVRGGGTELRSLAIRGSQGAGVWIDNLGGNAIRGCFIGTDATGASAFPNRWGVSITNSAGNLVGGATPADGNVISGNSLSGVRLSGASSTGNEIVGNTIGLDATRSKAIPNGFHGVHVTEAARGNTIGGTSAGLGNVISGNSDYGVAILDAVDTRVMGNLLGTTGDGRGVSGNGGGGIVVEGASTGTTIGGIAPGAGNVVAGNSGDGIALLGEGVADTKISGNAIGIDASGQLSLANDGDGIEIDGAQDVAIGEEATGNHISYNGGIGVRIRNSPTRDITLVANTIGFATPDTVRAANTGGAVSVENGATDVTIGGPETDLWNRIFGFVLVTDGATKRVRFTGNDVVVPDEYFTDRTVRMPFDLRGDGPSCACSGTGGTGPNDNAAAPHLLKIEPHVVEGMATPGATVSIYRVSASGTGRNRYFARSIEAIAVGTADGSGFFSISLQLDAGTRVVAAASDESGNSSEVTQLRRPIVFVHGIGGSWLVANDGTEIWLPDGAVPKTQNQNLMRLAFNEDGSSKEPITAREMLESAGGSVFEKRIAYGPPVDYLASKGFPGHVHNDNSAQIDLWRFYYDWRLTPAEPAQQLQALIDRVTGGGQDVARSCDVDIIAHSNGVVVSSVYIRGNTGHSRCRVNRFIAVGGPTLGTPLAAGAHTRGYIFGLEKENLYGHIFGKGMFVWWGHMIAMSRNLPAAWALMPGRAFWNAGTGVGSVYLEDLSGRPLTSHAATWRFLANPKTDGQGRPLGMDRNSGMWSREVNQTHGLIDDWRGFAGPPQVFRVVGKLPASTVERWMLTGVSPSRLRFALQSQKDRYEDGDTYEHWAYRQMLQPVLGWGDGTVLLASATLGHDPRGITDYSGVGTSKWIEDFAMFPCEHVPLVAPSCKSADGTLLSLDYIIQVLDGGHTVQAPITRPSIAATGALAATEQEIVYVTADAPVAVRVEDANGGYVGPPDPTNTALIDYLLPDVGYWPTAHAVCVSLPADRAYTLTATLPSDAGRVQVVRIRSNGGTDNTQVLFPPSQLSPNATVRLVFDNGGTLITMPLDLDADGNGAFEGTIAPAATIGGTSLTPAIPRPRPLRAEITAYRTDTAPRQMAVQFPDDGPVTWEWTSSAPAGWLSASSLAGQTPDSLVLSVDARQLATGVHRDTLDVTLALQGYQATISVAVHATVLESATLARIDVNPDFVALRPGDQQAFAATGFDETGNAFATNPRWTAEGGTISDDGVFTAGTINGLYFITASDASGDVTGEAAVQVTGGSDPTDAVMPTAFALHQNYPNPFNAGTTIVFDVAEPAHVRLTLYDVAGRLVRTIVDQEFGRGRHMAAVDDDRLVSGVYFYRVEMGAFSQTRKMVHLR